MVLLCDWAADAKRVNQILTPPKEAEVKEIVRHVPFGFLRSGSKSNIRAIDYPLIGEKQA
jgi:hypothetical protein